LAKWHRCDAEPNSPSAQPCPAETSDDADGDDTGVYQTSSGKWRRRVENLLAKTKSGGRKDESTPCFGTKAEAKRARQALKAKLDDKYWTSREALAKQDPTTADVPRAPDDIADAAPHKAYWVASRQNNHVPVRSVRTGTGNGKQGFKWMPACRHASECSNQAQTSKDGKQEFCQAHGGTACAHGPSWTRCMHCNGGAEGKIRYNTCNVCNSVELAAKRHTTNGAPILKFCRLRNGLVGQKVDQPGTKSEPMYEMANFVIRSRKSGA
jgi:hypothetical protein